MGARTQLFSKFAFVSVPLQRCINPSCIFCLLCVSESKWPPPTTPMFGRRWDIIGEGGVGGGGGHCDKTPLCDGWHSLSFYARYRPVTRMLYTRGPAGEGGQALQPTISTRVFFVWTHLILLFFFLGWWKGVKTIAGQCRTNPWPAVPDWTLMPECRCRTEAANYRKKCRFRTDFFPAFRHWHMLFSII